MTGLIIDGSANFLLSHAKFTASLGYSLSTSVRLTRLLTLNEAKQESCPTLDVSIQRFEEMAGAIGFEISDWRLIPNWEHFDLLLDVRLRENAGYE